MSADGFDKLLRFMEEELDARVPTTSEPYGALRQPPVNPPSVSHYTMHRDGSVTHNVPIFPKPPGPVNPSMFQDRPARGTNQKESQMDIEEAVERISAETETKTDASTIKALKKVRKKKSKGVEDGTVVKWKSSIYTYAAVFASGKWWITGTGRWYGGNVFEDAEFKANILAEAEEAWVVTGWAEL